MGGSYRTYYPVVRSSRRRLIANWLSTASGKPVMLDMTDLEKPSGLSNRPVPLFAGIASIGIQWMRAAPIPMGQSDTMLFLSSMTCRTTYHARERTVVCDLRE